MDHYDEFGNYIGPDLDNDSDLDDFDEEAEPEEDEADNQHALMVSGEDAMDEEVAENRIVLHEDKKYFPEAEEVFPGVKTVTLDEDAQDLSEPIIKPIKPKAFSVLEREPPKLAVDKEFMVGLMRTPALSRNVAIVGHLHHGKTSFVDTLVQAALAEPWDVRHPQMRYTDTRKDEQDRHISVKTTPISLVLQDVKDKYYMVNLLDAPGHVNFCDEATASLRCADGAIIVVDAVEGVMLSTERLLQEAVLGQLDICLVISKVDRLILELKLPPQDAYFKLLHTIEQCNSIMAQCVHNYHNHAVRASELRYSPSSLPRLSPELGNVCFASGQHNWSFTLLSFAHLYAQRHGGLAAEDLARRLWGDWHLHVPSQRLTKMRGKDSSGQADYVRSFVHFILEPLYKLYAQVVGESPSDLVPVFQSLGIKLVSQDIHNDPRALLRLSLQRFFGPPTGFVTMLAHAVADPREAAARVVSQYYTGSQSGALAEAMRRCDPAGPLLAHVTKLIPQADGQRFHAVVRVFSGTLLRGQRIRVLGEAFTAEDDEDMGIAEVGGIGLAFARWQEELNTAPAGSIVLVEGVDQFIKKTATLAFLPTDGSAAEVEDAAVFLPLRHQSRAVVKVAVEPFLPAELPKLVEGLRRVSKSYPLAVTKVEESGEHVVLGTGELYLDVLLHDLRTLFSDIEVKVSDPVVTFNETVVDSSSLACTSQTANKRNQLSVLAEPLDEGIAQDMERQYVDLALHSKQDVHNFFQTHHGMDALTCHNIWAFGPGDHDTNLLVNHSLPSETNQKLLFNVKDSIVQGFKWGTREGPLCDEPIRNVKFRLLGAQLAGEAIHRGGGQVIPAMRRAVYSSFLMASPRLMEPVFTTEIQAPADCIEAVHKVLSRRRGHVVSDTPKPGTPFYTIKAFLPVMDSFGFETDLRSYTLGQVFCQQVFDHWAVVPGDPLDRSVILHPLEPSPILALARDFMVKTRRRKGLIEEVSVNKYLDDAMLLRLAQFEEQQGGARQGLVPH